ncbi:MAG: AbrB/MazE/SpoVT family DNA-binding domain-containing protein [Hyphomonadaceae bacterium]|nr:AbrB/MazE/SpoVT family DNA-binding domain-containing protein [Hyphomonadaceae bacterium]
MTDETKKPQGVSDARPEAFEAEAPSKKPAGRTLKVRRIGNSLGVVLPKDVLAKLRVGEGDELTVSDTPDGVALTGFDDETARQIEIGRDLMKRYHNALRELAK